MIKQKIQQSEFCPEIYVYPTPRMYQPLKDFSLKDAEWTKDINLYVHIPFCKQICSYCGYLKTIDKEDLRTRYVGSIMREIGMYKNTLQDKNIKTLHFGGGTPSLLSDEELGNIINTISEINHGLITNADEISIEATPESVEYDKFFRYKKLGINRVSLGVQSMNAYEIGLSGRNNIPKISRTAIKTLKDIGIRNIVLDIMIGIDGQTVESFRESIEEIIALQPDTVELYALGMMPNTKIYNNGLKRMTNAEIYACYEIGQQAFLNAGYMQDCHNRYTLPNSGSFLQEDHVFEGMSLIGIGAGARSYAENIHYRNVHDSSDHRSSIYTYIDRINSGLNAVKTGVWIDKDEKMRKYIIGHIEELSLQDFYDRFNCDFQGIFPDEYQELLSENLWYLKQDVLLMSRRGLVYRDLIARQFFSKQADRAEMIYRPMQGEDHEE